MISDAFISDDKRYRYTLRRIWDESRSCLTWVLLNPSTANERENDATIRRCISFAEREDYGGIRVLNLFAFRATSPKELLKAVDMNGPKNNDFLHGVVRSDIVLAWGSWGIKFPERVQQVLRTLSSPDKQNRLFCFGRTKENQPRHPVRLAAETRLEPWS